MSEDTGYGEKLTVRPFYGKYLSSSTNMQPTTAETQANVLSGDISVGPSHSGPAAAAATVESATSNHSEEDKHQVPNFINNKSVQDLKMTDIKNSMSNLKINQKSPSMMSIDGAGQEAANNNNNNNDKNQQASQKSEQQAQPPTHRRKSTMILTEEAENALEEARKEHRKNHGLDNQDEDSTTPENREDDSINADNNKNVNSNNATPKLYPVEIKWIQGGAKVYVTGSFTGWTKMIKMKKLHDNDKEFVIRLNLPIGTHRFRFVVDNELRFSDYLPTATDSRGNFVNYLEILAEEEQPLQRTRKSSKDVRDENALNRLKQIEQNQQLLQEGLTPEQRAKLQQKARPKDSFLGLTQDDDDMGNGYTRFHEKSMLTSSEQRASKRDGSYTSNIPAIFTDPQAMERYYLTLDQQNRQNGGNNNQWLVPPALPPHLDHVILNNQQQNSNEGGFNKEINAGGSLPIPNHVILNHLATTSIKHNTLAVATTVRYKRKYLTQILYAPIQ